MVAVRVGELKERAEEIVRRLQETGEPVEILDQGQVVAMIVPAADPPPTQEELDAYWNEWDELSEDIGKVWPEGVTAVDAINDVRRDL
jgi:antitoxin (DNA-binding transcriptional repressor) of toxin-antitoxin stability system